MSLDAHDHGNCNLCDALEQWDAAKDTQIAALEKEVQAVDKALGDWLKDYDNRRGAIMNLRQCQMTAGENVAALKVQVAALEAEVGRLTQAKKVLE